MDRIVIAILIIVVWVLWQRHSARRDKERDERIREARRDKTWEEREAIDRGRRY